ncbi:MAG: hypothetical protein AAFR59_03280 [Bacteroidota bacterium]
MTPLIDYIKQKIANQETIKLNFICTHNSRRSHMAQIWAKAIATYLHLPIDTYSGGTEATAFNPNAIAAMQNAGFEISGDRQVHNPRYTIQMGAGLPTFQTWSKVFSDPTNPTQAFAAIMTCSDADENCPYVPGAELRVALTYEDPKAYDGSPQQASAYEARAKQIGAELYYILSHA